MKSTATGWHRKAESDRFPGRIPVPHPAGSLAEETRLAFSEFGRRGRRASGE